MSDHKDKYRYSLTFKIQMEKDMNIEWGGAMVGYLGITEEDGTWGLNKINMYENVIMKHTLYAIKTILK